MSLFHERSGEGKGQKDAGFLLWLSGIIVILAAAVAGILSYLLSTAWPAIFIPLLVGLFYALREILKVLRELQESDAAPDPEDPDPEGGPPGPSSPKQEDRAS